MRFPKVRAIFGGRSNASHNVLVGPFMSLGSNLQRSILAFRPTQRCISQKLATERKEEFEVLGKKVSSISLYGGGERKIGTRHYDYTTRWTTLRIHWSNAFFYNRHTLNHLRLSCFCYRINISKPMYMYFLAAKPNTILLVGHLLCFVFAHCTYNRQVQKKKNK